jgi:hypothetical protein
VNGRMRGCVFHSPGKNVGLQHGRKRVRPLASGPTLHLRVFPSCISASSVRARSLASVTENRSTGPIVNRQGATD